MKLWDFFQIVVERQITGGFRQFFWHSQKIWTLIVKDTLWNILTFTDDASDAYIDKVLENLRQAIADNGLDPADLPNGEVGFEETILGITFHGKAEVHDGFFQGTS